MAINILMRICITKNDKSLPGDENEIINFSRDCIGNIGN